MPIKVPFRRPTCFNCLRFSKWWLILIVFAGCRISVPTIAEQRELLGRGAFPGGPPSWMPSSALSGAGTRDFATGVFPEGFAAQGINASNNEEVSRFDIPTENSQVKELEQRSNEQSPIGRISKLCPGVETDVSKALINESLAERLSAFERLVRRCPTSFDLWYWYARDLRSAGNLTATESALGKALKLNPQHNESREMLGEIRELSNSPISPRL